MYWYASLKKEIDREDEGKIRRKGRGLACISRKLPNYQ